MNEIQLRNKVMTLTSSVGVLLVALGFVVYLSGDIAGDFKRDVYSVTLSGDTDRERVNTLESAIFTSVTIATSLKKLVAKIETIGLKNVPQYIEGIRPHFEKKYFDTFSEDQKKKAKHFISSDVRVVEFVVTEDPVFLGVDISSPKPAWVFYLEGQYSREGLFDKRNDDSTFGSVGIFIEVQEATGQNGNPSGIEIVSYKLTR